MELEKNKKGGDIAVVGASALYPGSVGGAAFWTNILSGRDFMSDVPADHWLVEDYYDADPRASGKVYAKRGGFLPKIDFDPMEHGLPPKQLSTTDTAQLLGLIVAQKVLDDAASVQFGKVDKKNISVILGVASATELVGQMAARIQRPHWIKALRDAGLPESEVQTLCDRIESTYPEWDESTFPGLLGNVVAGRIANRMNLGGTNCVIDAACASSLGAVAMAVQELQLGHSDLVITGGVDALNDIFMFMCFSKTPALSPTGDCRPFSEDADGTMLGEGLGMVALRRLEDAERDGDKIYAVIRGIGSASDGRAKSIYAPRAEGQELAIRRAYERAGYGPEEVGLVEAHGTATKAGDLAEFSGLVRAFGGAARSDKQWCALGSVKSQIGHTKAAAGAASLFKVVMALHHKVLPPTIKVSKPNAKLDIESSPFYLNTQARPWIQAPQKTRKGSVSSFGFGGSNFHVALEEYAGEKANAHRVSSLPVHLLLLDADDAAGLIAKAQALRAALGSAALPAQARQSQLAFNAQAHCRLALLASDAKAAVADIDHAIATLGKNPAQPFSLVNRMYYGVGAASPKLAFVFPGQGSQYVNMGAALAMEFDAARRTWDEAAALPLDPQRSLHDVVFPVPVFSDEERQAQSALLTRTDWAQPAIGATSMSMLRLLEQLGVRPQATAGHSYGELAALYAAGAITSPASLLAISRRRGELMNQAASTPGAMMAVRASAQKVAELIAAHAAGGVSIANINSPSQVVVAGETPAIEDFQRALQAAQVSCQRLPVATAFHTTLVAGCSAPFEQFLADVQVEAPRVTVYANTTAAPYPVAPDDIRGTLARQLAQPVRFEEMIHRMHDDGCRVFVEVGPGAALTGMVGDCLKQKEHVAVALDNRKGDGRAAFINALAVLSSQGVAVDYAVFWQEFAAFEATPAADKLSPAAVKLSGANYGKPYPPAEGAAAVPAPNPERPAQIGVAPVASARAAVAPAQVAVTPASAPQSTAPQTVAAQAVQAAQAVPAAPAAPAAGQAVFSAEWGAAFQALQQQTLEAQKAFTQTLGESHQAFLRASEVAFMQLGQLAGGPVATAGLPPVQGGFAYTPAAAPLAPAAATIAPAAAPAAMPAAVPVAAPVAALVLSEAAPQAATPAVLPPAAPAVDHQSLLLEVVADKTGYPVSMLSLDMELEAGLGIDSIKRVEILSALQEKVPGLDGVDTAQLAALNTLGEIVAFAAAAAPRPARASANAAAPVAVATAAVAPAVVAPAAADHQALLLEVVAEKTGYPVGMLTLDMELEAGLGIDSIKRVEILSALQEKIPGLSNVDTAQLAALNTLGEIVAFAKGNAPAAAPAAPAAPAAVAATAGVTAVSAVSAVPAVDHKALLLSVVAEKTGYPESMLSLDMELEAGLGIDSIKRVEILSALQSQIPALANVDTGRLAALNTLGEILDFSLETVGGAAPASAATGAPQPAAAAAQGPVLRRLAVSAVETPASGLVTPGLLQTAPLYLVGDRQGVAGLLAERLGDAGIATQVVAAPPEDARAVVILSALDARADDAQVQAQQNEAVFSHLKACAASMGGNGILLVTVQDTGGDFGLGGGAGNRAWSAGIVAAAKTAALEWPHVEVKAIDIEAGGRDGAAIAQALCAELLAGGSQLEVGLKADGLRLSPVALEEQGIAAIAAPVSADGVIVVSGGARGVTAACLAELITRSPGVKIAILGRTALQDEPAELAGLATDAQLKQALLARHSAAGQAVTPQQLGAQVRELLAQRELRANLDRFAALGATVRYYAADVADAGAVTSAIDAIRAGFGPIHGLVHAAGVLADKEIRQKTLEQFQKVLRTKVDGLRHLLAATRDDALTHILCFSSVAARRGNVGQIDYAMANEVLNRVCREERSRRGASCLVKAIGWGPWAGGMVDAGLEKHFSAMGVALIPLDDGARLFADEYTGRNGDATEVVFGGGLDSFGAVAGKRRDAAAFEVRFHRSTHAYIASHVIRDMPVVPMVVVNDLALHAVQAFCEGETIVGTANLNVVKGIQLRHFDAGGDLYRIECRRDDGKAQAAVRIVDGDGVLHYTLDVLLGARLENVAELAQKRLPALRPWQPESGAIYDGRLFHGPDLQVIESLQGIGANACSGTLVSRIPHAFGYVAHPDVLDGGLQLAVLWVHEHKGCESLPTGFGQFRMHRAWHHGEPVVCEAYCEAQTSLMTRWTLLYRNTSGDLLASIEGLKIHLLPDSPSVPASDSTIAARAA